MSAEDDEVPAAVPPAMTAHAEAVTLLVHSSPLFRNHDVLVLMGGTEGLSIATHWGVSASEIRGQSAFLNAVAIMCAQALSSLARLTPDPENFALDVALMVAEFVKERAGEPLGRTVLGGCGERPPTLQ